MYLDKGSEKKWLVKSENIILGPYSFDQIIDMIRKRQISLIDEIRDPETRWLYIRENPEFKNLAEEIRKEIDEKQESTKTYQSISKTEEVVLRTRTDANPYTDINLETKDATVIKEILSNSLDTPAQHRSEKAKVYGVKTDRVVQKKISIFSSHALVITLLVGVFSVAGFMGYLFYQKRTVQLQEEQWAQQIRKYRLLGLYQKAADLYAKLPSANQKKLLPDLLEMFPLLESAGLVQAEEVRQLRSQSQLSLEQKSNIELVDFWIEMRQQNYSRAEVYLVQASKHTPGSFLVRENEAILSYKRGQHERAYGVYEKIFAQEKKGRYLLGMVIAFQALDNASQSKYARDVAENIMRYSAVYYDFKKELSLARIYLFNTIGDADRTQMALADFFGTPIKLSEKFYQPLLLAPNFYSWKDLRPARDSAQRVLTGDELILFQLHDLLEDGKLSVATDYIRENSAKVADQLVRLQMNNLLLFAQGQYKDLVAIEKLGQYSAEQEINHFIFSLAKINSDADISSHLAFYKRKGLLFYHDWLELEQMLKAKDTDRIRQYLKDHFITIENFMPVFEAKSLVNQ